MKAYHARRFLQGHFLSIQAACVPYRLSSKPSSFVGQQVWAIDRQILWNWKVSD